MTDSDIFRSAIVRHAKSFVGEKEIAGNMGFYSHKLDTLARDSGFQNGYAWCCIFCEVIYKLALDDLEKQTGKSFKTLRASIARCITPSTQQSYNNAKDNPFLSQTQTPKIGDIVIFVNTRNRIYGHAGIVTDLINGGFWTVEGNTNTSGSAEGDGVYAKWRTVEKDGRGLDVRGFISPIPF